MKEKARLEIERLRREIERHNFMYYVENSPEISDREFDGLMQRLIDLEAAHPEFRSQDSPTMKVGGAPVEGFARIRHETPMLSIEFVRTAEKLREFDGRARKKLGRAPSGWVVEPKIDGVAVSLRYERGVLVRGGTRGDGNEGDDITANLSAVRDIPLRLDPLGRAGQAPEVLEVRGEAYMTWAAFENLNLKLREAGEQAFANPRNSTAGTLKLLDSRTVAARKLSFAAHGTGSPVGERFGTYTEIREYFRNAGIPAASPAERCKDMEEVISLIGRREEERRNLPFPSDGIVIKADDLDERESIGFAPKYPRWAIAFKFDAEAAMSSILSVDFQVGQSGQVTPVANMESVELGGTVVSRASLHNFEMTDRKDIRRGDRVIVEKAGEIIPYVVRSIIELRSGDAEPLRPPDACTVCGGPLTPDEARIAVSCGNAGCPGRIKAQLRLYASRGAMDIEGLGDRLIDLLVDGGLARSPADLYALGAADFESLERMGPKSAAALVSAIEASKGRGLARLLFALGIQHVGAEAARKIAARFGSLAAVMSAGLSELEDAEAVGPVLAASVHDFFRDGGNRALVDRLASAGVAMGNEAPAAESEPGPLHGKTVVVTGRIEGHTRESIEDLLRGMGASVAGSVSGKTSFVLAGEDAGSKAEKARGMGIPVIGYEEFLTSWNPQKGQKP